MQAPSNIVEKYVISADGTRIFAGAVGDPSNPALVFVHGFTLSGDIFNDLFANPVYSKDFYLVRFDLRGHGRTGKPNSEDYYSSKKHSEDYAAIVRVFKIKRPIIIGWSLGGSIPGDVAAHLPPDSMCGAVYIASHPTLKISLPSIVRHGFVPIFDMRYDEVKSATDFPIAFNRICLSRDIDVSEDYLAETIKLNDAGVDFVSENPAATQSIRSFMLGVAAVMKPIHRKYSTIHLGDPSKMPDLLAEGFPILQVIGSHDSILDCNGIVESVKPMARNLETCIIEGASHTPFVDDPEGVMSAILKFARRVNSSHDE